MATWVDGNIDVTIEMGFGSTPFTVSPTWTDISAFVRSISTNRGRTSELGTFSPGTCTLEIDDRDRRFDHSYSNADRSSASLSAPYDDNTNFVPMLPVRVRSTLGGTTNDLFRGFVLGWQHSWGHTDGIAVVSAVDGTRILDHSDLKGSAFEQVVNDADPSHWWTMTSNASGFTDEIAGDKLVLTGGAGADGTLDAPLNFTGGVAATVTATWSNEDFQTFDPAEVQSIEFWYQYDDATSVDGDYLELRFGSEDTKSLMQVNMYIPDTSTAAFQNALLVYHQSVDNNKQTEATGLPWYAATPNLWDGEPHHIAVRATSTTIYLYIDGTEVDSNTLVAGNNYAASHGVQVIIPPGQAISNIVLYAGDVGAVGIAEHWQAGFHAWGWPTGERAGDRIGRMLDAADWPTADRDIATGTVPLGPWNPNEESAMAAIRSIEATESGLFFFAGDGKATFRDRQWLWTDADTDAPVFTDDGNSGDLKFSGIQPSANHVDAIRNEVVVTYDGGTYPRRDATSIASYGKQTVAIGSVFEDFGARRSAINLARYRLRISCECDPFIPRLTVKMLHTAGDNEHEKLTGIDLGDVITVEHTPLGVGSQFVRDVMTTGIQHRITQNDWTVTLYTSPEIPNSADTPYLELAHADRGDIGVAAGNVIPG